MTLILTVGNRENLVQVSDRRVSLGSVISDELSQKAIVFNCNDARLAVAYCGLAWFGDFTTRDWILGALFESATKSDYKIAGILQRFEQRANETFEKNRSIRRVSKGLRRLSIVFSGFLYERRPYPVPAQAILTNYQNFVTGRDSAEADAKFHFHHTIEREGVERSGYVQRFGNWRVIDPQDVDELLALAREGKPVDAIVNTATALLLRARNRPAAGNTIGPNTSFVIVPSDPASTPRGGGGYDQPVWTIDMPDIVSMDGNGEMVAKSPTFGAVDPDDGVPPLAVPARRQRAPCACGSGKRYKDCHGLRVFARRP